MVESDIRDFRQFIIDRKYPDILADKIVHVVKNEKYNLIKAKSRFMAAENCFVGKHIDFKEYLKMLEIDHRIATVTLNRVKERIDYFAGKGFDADQIIFITKMAPSVYAMSEKMLGEYESTIRAFGFTHDEFVSIVSRWPSIYNRTILNLTVTEKIVVTDFKYSIEEFRTIFHAEPSISKKWPGTLVNKLSCFDRIGLRKYCVENPGILHKSAPLTYARSQYLLRSGIPLNEDSYELLFLSEEEFRLKLDCNISSEELLIMFPYKKLPLKVLGKSLEKKEYLYPH